VAGALLLACGPIFAETVDLLCQAGTDPHPKAVTVLRLNYDHHTVNGIRADFSDAEIKWTTVSNEQGRVWYYDHTLNRFAGTYRFGARGAIYPAPPPLYSCEKAPAAKF
jgi:hypothetical protein